MVQIVRYGKGKNKFEIITIDGAVRKFRDHKLKFDQVLAIENVFLDSKKGNIAQEKNLQNAFQTTDVMKCCEIIALKGDLQESAEERKEDMEKHRKAILNRLNKHYVDAKGLPHPVSRLEDAVKKSGVRLCSTKSVEKQCDEIIKKLEGVLVFRKKNVQTYTLKMLASDSDKIKNLLYKYSENAHEKREGNQSIWTVVFEQESMGKFLAASEKVIDFTYQMSEYNPMDSKKNSENPKQQGRDNKKKPSKFKGNKKPKWKKGKNKNVANEADERD
jgi:ribosome maturation protein SDO1